MRGLLYTLFVAILGCGSANPPLRPLQAAAADGHASDAATPADVQLCRDLPLERDAVVDFTNVAIDATDPQSIQVRPVDRSDVSSGADNRRPTPSTADVAGSAKLRIRIETTGRVTPQYIIEATDHEFAEACCRSLRASQWTPALDSQGQPLAKSVVFTCNFELE